VTLLAVAVSGERSGSYGVASCAGSVRSFGDAMIRLFVIDRIARFGEGFSVTGVALIFYTLIVLPMRERDVAVLGVKQDRLRWGHGGRELLNNGLITVGRRYWNRG
jgi:hypothetical protein